MSEEATMITDNRAWLSGMIAAYAGIILESASFIAENSGEFHTVSGIIEYAGEDILTIKSKPRDITGASFIDRSGRMLFERGRALHGKIAVILYQERQPVSVTIIPFA